MTEELKPCPFCGNKNEDYEHELNGEDRRFCYSCGHCGAKAPGGDCIHEAVEEWNKRA
jgi:Lar family restriction alleviation protein